MRANKGKAQFLLLAFFILAILVHACTRNDHQPTGVAGKPPAAAAQTSEDIDE